MDFGRLTLAPDLVLYLFGTPGSATVPGSRVGRPVRGAIGAIVAGRHRAPGRVVLAPGLLRVQGPARSSWRSTSSTAAQQYALDDVAKAAGAARPRADHRGSTRAIGRRLSRHCSGSRSTLKQAAQHRDNRHGGELTWSVQQARPVVPCPSSAASWVCCDPDRPAGRPVRGDRRRRRSGAAEAGAGQGRAPDRLHEPPVRAVRVQEEGRDRRQHRSGRRGREEAWRRPGDRQHGLRRDPVRRSAQRGQVRRRRRRDDDHR